MKRFLVLIVLMVFLSTGAAFGQSTFVSGGDLVQWSADLDAMLTGSGGGAEMVNGSQMLGYIEAVADIGQMSDTLAIPDGTNIRSLFNVVRAYLIAHPNSGSEAGCVVILNALHAAYPATQKKQSY